MTGVDDAERELEKVEEVLAMAERAIQISRLEQERISSELPASGPGPVEESGPAAGTT